MENQNIITIVNVTYEDDVSVRIDRYNHVGDYGYYMDCDKVDKDDIVHTVEDVLYNYCRRYYKPYIQDGKVDEIVTTVSDTIDPIDKNKYEFFTFRNEDQLVFIIVNCDILEHVDLF